LVLSGGISIEPVAAWSGKTPVASGNGPPQPDRESALDQCLEDWGRMAATEPVPPASWFREDLPVQLSAVPVPSTEAKEAPHAPVWGQLAALAVAALLWSAEPRPTSGIKTRGTLPGSRGSQAWTSAPWRIGNHV
jgi:hypothetical protein